MSAAPAPTVDDFIQRWSKASGSELANAQTFVIELCAALALAPPNPASGDELANDYVLSALSHSRTPMAPSLRSH